MDHYHISFIAERLRSMVRENDRQLLWLINICNRTLRPEQLKCLKEML